MTKEEKLAKAKQARETINKDKGKGSIFSLEDVADLYDVISTGSIGLNLALGIKGLPKGRAVEMYGLESSGKTTIATHIIAEAQKVGGLAAIVDAEHAFDKEYAKKIGVNTEELDISQPDCGEDAIDILSTLIDSGAYDVIVVDSIPALVPKAELEGTAEENKMMLHAKLMSKMFRVLIPKIHKNKVLVIFINQMRQKPVLMGDPHTTPGGLGARFACSIRMEVSRSTTKDNSVFGEIKDVKIGNLTKVNVIKNKLAAPFKKCEFDILYNIGIDKFSEIIEICNDFKIIKKWGDTITYKEDKYTVAQFKDLLTTNEDFYKTLEQQCYEA